MRELIDKLNYYTKLYDEGHPEITDQEWDNLYFKLKKMEEETGIVYPDSPTQGISFEVLNALEKVEHNHPMLSLDKTKDMNEVYKFLGNNDFLTMCKMDGLTCSLRYLNGKLESAETRGDGTTGENILHNAKVVRNIPQTINYKDELIVDGEIICKYDDFVPFSVEYQNPRNFASGSIRLLDSAECAKRNLTFVAWDVIKGYDDIDSLSTRLTNLDKLGFEVVPWVASDDFDAKEFVRNLATEKGYPIDGLVFKFDSISFGKSRGSTGHHLKNAIAFKFYDEPVETHLQNIEWTMGRTGVLTPVAVFDDIDIEGTSVTRASLHNVNIMTGLLGTPYKNQLIKVFKANMIIPQVLEAEIKNPNIEEAEWLSVPVLCPYCGEPTHLETMESGTINLICGNENCGGKLINRLDHFCGKKGLDIKGLSVSTLEKLINWGWVNSISDIYKLARHRVDWYSKEGFGKASVDKILDAIVASTDIKEPWRLISAFGIPLIGSTASKALMKHFTLDEFIALAKDKYDFTVLDDFGSESNNAIWNYNFEEMDNMLENVFIVHETPKVKIEDNKCKDKTFVITGSLNHFNNRDELKEIIENLGGKVSGSVSAKTTCLINNDVNSTSSKNNKAKALGVPIISEDEFMKNYLDKN